MVMISMAKSKNPSFEESFEELDQAVQKLEGGDLTLEDALSLFERGMQLAAQLEQQLEQAELRVRKLKPSTIDLEEAAAEGPDEEADFP
jgi:exodeoxyribonuclease VII small subunit